MTKKHSVEKIKNKKIKLSEEPSLSYREKNARLASFVELNPRPIIETDLRGNVIYENPVSKEFFPDLREKGLNHKYLYDFQNILEDLKRDPNKGFIARAVEVKNEWFRQLFYYVPEFKSVRIYGLDITEHIEETKKLKRKEIHYQSLFNKMQEGYAIYEIMLDKQGRPYDCLIVDFNPAFEIILGMRRKDAIGKTLKSLFPEADLKSIKKYFQVALTNTPTKFEQSYEKLNKYYEVFVHRVGKKQFAALFMDITDRKNIEKEKDNFISIMSHELRNPLTAILGNAQLLRNKLHLGESFSRELVEIVERQARNMAKLLDDLLDTSRLSRKRIKLRKQAVNLSETIQHALEVNSSFIKEKRHKISITLPSQDIFIEADPMRVQQILVNLINNAAKYTDKEGHIWISLSSKDSVAVIKVRDNGIGMTPGKIKKIFDLFNESPNLAFISIGSFGVGMNLTKHLVRLHKGKILVSSKGENKGSTFTILLPNMLKHYKEENILPEANVEEIRNKSKVLIVDDEKDIANLLSKVLTSQGYKTKVTYNGFEAIEASRVFKPEIALVDIGIPGMNGYKVAEQLRRENADKIKLIAVTGYGQAKDKLQAEKAGFDYHLIKPIDIDSLVKLLG